LIAVPTPDPRIGEVLAFWFGDDGDDANVIAAQGPLWFRGGDAVDARIRDRFAAQREDAVAGRLNDDWGATPRGQLARVILVDQFSRNLFRDDPRAFEHDTLARQWTDTALDEGTDRLLRPIERVFLYLPLEHAESLADQRRSVRAFEALVDEAPAPLHDAFANYLDYARRHHDVIARFGRFPHRNAVLGRPSTTEEIEFLRQPGSSF